MKHALTVLVLALVLVFAMGNLALASETDNIFPPLDGGGLSDDGSEDEDHPWGGDRTIGDGSDKPDIEYIRLSAISGSVILDLLIERLYQYFYRPDDVKVSGRLIKSDREQRSGTTDDLSASSALSSPSRTWKAVR